MDKESYSWGGIGFLAIFFLILIAVFFRGGNGFGWGTNGVMGGMTYGHNPNSFDNYKATCDAEKAEIINTATTQYRVEQQAAQTRELVSATANATQQKIDYYALQDLRDKLSESQRENMMLQNKLFVKDQIAPLTAQLSDISCRMLTKPELSGLSTSCNPIITPYLFGWGNGYNNGCNGSNSLV